MRVRQGTVHGWGRYRPVAATLHAPDDVGELATAELPAARVIARGLGRSYGDAAHLSGGNVIDTTACTRLDWVDREAGIIRADAGVSIGQIIDRFAPKGWFVPVTPGTRRVSVGGAIAADIHGKNHHVDGSFGAYVRSMRVRLASDEIVTLSPETTPEFFWATVGGMGLTGIIVDAVVQLVAIPTTTVAVETQRLENLHELTLEMRRTDVHHAFSVAWVDLLGQGRSVLTQGSFASTDRIAELGGVDPAGTHQQPPDWHVSLPPLPLPRVAVTPAIRAFNELWWRKSPAAPTVTGQSITAFFHPLDAISDWNRVYGPRGFVQWQCVIPDEADSTLFELAERLASLPSYFSVLKRFGRENDGPLSFPKPGWTLAVDLPATSSVLVGLSALDHLVADAGGRIYLAKDARLERQSFERMYPRLDLFKTVRRTMDPTGRFLSDLGARLDL